jgi:trafficking protein particle complex subunit 11
VLEFLFGDSSSKDTMNSYPPELLVQLAPVMFVAGLSSAAAAEPQTPASASTSPTANRPDAFEMLNARLRDALSAQRKVSVWHPDKAKTFQVVLVDKVRCEIVTG